MSNAQNNAMKSLLKGALSGFPEEEKANYEAAYSEINATLDKYGDGGLIVLSMIGLELQDD